MSRHLKARLARKINTTRLPVLRSLSRAHGQNSAVNIRTKINEILARQYELVTAIQELFKGFQYPLNQ